MNVNSTGSVLLAAILAGLLAGLVVAVFHTVATEPTIEQAIALEEAHQAEMHGANAVEEPPVVSRDVQRVGLVIGYVFYGLFIGLLFGVAWRLVQPRFPVASGWLNGLLTALAAWWLVGLLPALKYPANPPGVGDPDTIGYRQALFLLFIVLSIGGALVAGWSWRLLRARLAGRGALYAALAVYAVYAVALFVLMPQNPDENTMPPALVSSFRTLNLVGTALFWVVLGLLFGWLLDRLGPARQGRAPVDGPRPARATPGESSGGSSSPLQRHTGPAALEFCGVTCAYERKPVLSDISLRIEPGQFVGLVGPSGSGKTTFLKAALGLLQPLTGQVLVDGQPVADGGARLGYVPQVETVDWSFPVTVEEVVQMGRTMELGPWPWAGRRARAEVRDLLDRLGLAGLAERHIRDLSGGQQQRVFLARALIRRPRLLLLDEPTSGVDIRTRHEILHLLSELQAAGTTIILSTHELNAVATHLPQVVCLNCTVLAQGPPAIVFRDEVLTRLYGAPLRVVRDGDVTVVVDHPRLPLGGQGSQPGERHTHPPTVRTGSS